MQENNGNAENSRRSGRIALKNDVYAERRKQAEELEKKLKVGSSRLSMYRIDFAKGLYFCP
jgi:hypothetical protein